MNNFDKEELEIIAAEEAGTLRSVPNLKRELAKHRAAAAATFAKDARINIRISSKDLRALQKSALGEGMPYQTFVGSLLHKYVEGRLVATA